MRAAMGSAFFRFLLILALGWVAPLGALADGRAPIDGAYVYVEPTGFEDIFTTGLSASPTPDSREFADAIAQFVDPRAAMEGLARLRKTPGPERAFVEFNIENGEPMSGEVNVICGVSPSRSRDAQEVVDASSALSIDQKGDGSFSNFKRASRAERVRAMARCLHSLPGMPALKPTPRPPLRKLYIDETSYRLAERWIRTSDPQGYQGSPDQYRQAFRCMLTEAARAHPEMTGDSVVVRTMTDRYTVQTSEGQWVIGSGYHPAQFADGKQKVTTISFLEQERVDDQFSASHVDDLFGLWPTTLGIDEPGFFINGVSDPIEQALGPKGVSFLHECRRRAGLFELPPARVPEPVTGPPCHAMGQ